MVINIRLPSNSLGQLFIWGEGGNGRLGLGNTSDQSSPVQISGSWISVDGGRDHTMGIRNDGSLWTWGRNNQGQLGQGDSGGGTHHSSPVQVGSDSTWIEVNAAFLRFSMAIKK